MKPLNYVNFGIYSKDLVKQIQIIQQNMCEKCQKVQQILDSSSIAWGQYLDDSRPGQYGVFGTSAAIKILRYCDCHNKQVVITKAQAYLLDKFNSRSTRPYEEYYFGLTLKSIFLMQGFTSHEFSSEKYAAQLWEDRLQYFLKSRLPDGAWGFYYYDVNKRDETSDIIPTCYTLLLFKSFERVGDLGNYDKSISWLVKQLRNYKNSPLALTLLLLYTLRCLQYKDEPSLLIEIHKFLKKRFSSERILSTPPYTYIYYVQLDGQQHEEYFIIDTAFLVFDYFAHFDTWFLLSGNILEELESLLQYIQRHGLYIDPQTGRSPTLTNHQAFLFLNQISFFLSKTSSTVLTGQFLIKAFIGICTWKNFFRFLIAGLIAYFVINATPIGSFGAIVSSIAASVLVNIIADFITRSKK